jgi:hypothetical protein
VKSKILCAFKVAKNPFFCDVVLLMVVIQETRQ